ncbi:MAG: VWA domain-containing protein [Pirellulaceae bacterium]
MRNITLLLFGVVFWSVSPQIMRAEQTVVVVLDDSGSMAEKMRTSNGRMKRMDVAKSALLRVLGDLPEDTQVGVLALNTEVNGDTWIVPLGEGASTQWEANIERIRPVGGTPLGAALRMGADALLEARSARPYATFRLLIVTDGEANDPELVDAYLPQVMARGIVTDVIGVDMKSQHTLATRAHSYRSAADDAALERAIGEVFAETSADDQNAEEDFELLASLPDGFAEEALRALTAVRNEPLQEAAEYRAATPSFTRTINSSGGSQPNNSIFDALLGSMMCCFGVFFGLAILVVVLAGSRKQRRR